MKYIILLLLINPSLCFAGSEYWFEALTKNRSIKPANSQIQAKMKGIAKEDFEDCKKQLHMSNKEMESYFYSLPIDINTTKLQSYLILPSKYCYAFYGMHSIQFWIIEKQKENIYNLVLSAREDGLEILDTKTNGYADLKLFYGQDVKKLVFDGKSYREKDKN